MIFSNLYFLHLDSKLDDLYMLLDRINKKNTMVKSVMYFYKVPKLGNGLSFPTRNSGFSLLQHFWLLNRSYYKEEVSKTY
jgi:hypothetical protein